MFDKKVNVELLVGGSGDKESYCVKRSGYFFRAR